MDRQTKTLFAVFLLVASGLFAMGNAINRDPIEDWLIAGVLFALSLGFWLWLWLETPASDEDESSALMPIDDTLPKAQEWIISKETVDDLSKEAEQAPVEEAPAPVSGNESDDLTQVEGIGPKYREAFYAAGITTFEQLAALPVERIEEIAHEHGMRRSASMNTWTEQAKLAATGDWEALEALKAQLIGGRRED